MNSTDENEIMYLFDMSAQIVLDLVVCFFIIFLIFVIAFIICKLNNFYKFQDKRLKNLYSPIRDNTHSIKVKTYESCVNETKDLPL